MQRAATAVTSVLFFFSGATGLAYEVVWFKQFSHVWGTSTFAISSVVACFLLGLAAGAALFGRLATRARSPLRWYAACEAAIAVLALAIPAELALLLPAAAVLENLLEGVPGAHAAIRILLTLAVIGPPCVLMGGTLPLLVRQITDGSADRPAAWLYAVNTTGAAFGCYVTGFHLLPVLGLSWTNAAAAGLNVLIGAVALLAATRAGEISRTAADAAPASPEALSSKRLLPAATLTGAASLSLQMIWNRELALILGGSTYAFTAMLFVMLLGIGAGSLLVRAILSSGARFDRLPAVVVLVVIATTLVGQYAIMPLTEIVALLSPSRTSLGANAAISVGASMVLELLPALAMGVLFPLFVHASGAGKGAAPRAVGLLYAWNTAGTIVGTLATPLLLIPWLGTDGTLSLSLAGYGLAFVLMWPWSARAHRVPGLVGSAASLALPFVFLAPSDPLVENSGAFLYGYGPSTELTRSAKVLFFREGRAANVLVTREGAGTLLRVNGKIDASDRTDMAMQVGLAYFPRFFRPRAERVLVIGHGSGTTPGASLLFPGTTVVTCEIEPAVFEAASHFAHVNHRPEDAPGFSLVTDDGRSFLQRTDERFDLILSEPSNPWMAGVSNLFTREFYEVAAEKLREGGLLAQWIQTYAFTPERYALVARTLVDVFPHHRLIRITDGDTILLASRTPLAPEAAEIAEAQALVERNDAVRRDLETYLGSSDVASLLLAHAILDEAGLRRLVAKTEERNTDRNMRLEFDAPLHLFHDSGPLIAEVSRAILSATDPDRMAADLDQWGPTPARIDALRTLTGLFVARNLNEQAARLVTALLARSPEHPGLLGERLVLAPPEHDAEASANVGTLVAASETWANRVGVSLTREGRHGLAASLFERLTEVNPHSVTAWTNLAAAYRDAGRSTDARAAFRKALDLDPLNEAAAEAYRALDGAG